MYQVEGSPTLSISAGLTGLTVPKLLQARLSEVLTLIPIPMPFPSPPVPVLCTLHRACLGIDFLTGGGGLCGICMAGRFSVVRSGVRMNLSMF